VLEFAASLPPDYRVKGAMTKRILKDAFRKRIPKEIIKRKKAGFPIPIERWIQNELREEVRQVLLSKRCLDRGYFRKESVEALLDSGDRGQPLAKEVFSLLTFELLQTQFVDR
jgi:asparagine synthase (glutamine-hydrolysing)